MVLSQKLSNSIHDFIEEAEKQEQLIKDKDIAIQSIVKDCELALEHPYLVEEVLKNIIEEYKNVI